MNFERYWSANRGRSQSDALSQMFIDSYYNTAVVRNAKKGYTICVTSIEETEKMFLTDDRLNVLHDTIQKKAKEFFVEREKFTGESILNQLISDIDEEFGNWKCRNQLLKEKIRSTNKDSLEDAKKIYSSTMDDWLKSSTKPFFTLNDLNEEREMIQKKATDQLKSQLKGPNDDFTLPFLDQLRQFIESQKRQEEDRLELELIRMKERLWEEKKKNGNREEPKSKRLRGSPEQQDTAREAEEQQ